MLRGPTATWALRYFSCSPTQILTTIALARYFARGWRNSTVGDRGPRFYHQATRTVAWTTSSIVLAAIRTVTS